MPETGTTNKSIIIHGAPMAWCLGVYFDTDVNVSDDAPATPPSGDEFRMLFDNIASASVKIPVAGAESTGENIDITAADGAIIRFPKVSRIIDGTNDTTTLTEVDADEDATGKGEITIVTNQGDMDSTTWSGFVNKVITNKDALWYIVVPTGFNYNNRYAEGTTKADGFIYMLGKLSSDVDLTIDANPATLSLTFKSYKYSNGSSLFASSMLDSAFAHTFTGIKLKATDKLITPPTLSTGASSESTTIGAGGVVLKEVSHP